MKIEKIHIPQYSFKSRQNDYLWRYSNFDKFWRALERARMYDGSEIEASIKYRIDLCFTLLQFDENFVITYHSETYNYTVSIDFYEPQIGGKI